MPTEAQIQTTLADLFRIADEFLLYATANAEKFTEGSGSHEGTFIGNLQTDYRHTAEMVRGVEDFRAGLADQLNRIQPMVDAALREYAQIMSYPESDPLQILDRLYDNFHDNTLRVQERNVTFGQPAAASSNNGDGVINRLYVDENGYEIENVTADAKSAECVADEDSGAQKHEEIFQLRGGDRGRDDLIIPGSGFRKRLKCLSARDSFDFINNPSFETFTGTAAVPTSIVDWTITTADLANLELDSTITYRDYEGAPSTHYSLKFTQPTSQSGIEFQQDMKERRVSIRPDVPLYAHVAVYKVGSGGTGTITFNCGAAGSTPVNISDLTDNGWTIIRVGGTATPPVPATGGSVDNWYKNWRQNTTLRVEFTIDGSVDVGRVLHLDDVVIAPYSKFDGNWYAAVGGASKFTLFDSFTWTDTISSDSIIQKWFHRLYDRYLPAGVASTVTFADPT